MSVSDGDVPPRKMANRLSTKSLFDKAGICLSPKDMG